MAKNRKVYHVVPTKDGDWAVKREGAKRASVRTSTKSEAINKGRELAKSSRLSQLKIHKQNGKFQTEYTYGKDPFPPRG